ncbi:hypothetical protein LOY69_29240 [Pseudomonas sp. B21-059]|uniref:hypothetical protein n=1 Tax=Pseudomonas sp. B21-059 TaxID=2895496 RepID=UPI00223488D6|nr:hypothetical protein [Pseudomonas sp. B21-059]UZE34726.1 hypothetical protein LOY69_29240 [Pseudomonas sp. B21-059]
MIINIPSKLDLHINREDKIIALENIIKSHGEGKHLVWMHAATIKELSQIEEFGHFTKRTLNALISQSTEYAYIHKQFDFYVSVNFEDKHALSYSDGVLNAGYLKFRDSTSTQQPILLAENDHDGEIYSWGAKTYLQIKGLNNLKFNIEILSGGGSTTYDCFIRLNSGLRFFTCYIDSDKCHPKWPLGGTAARFKYIPPGYKERRYLEILECHEVENIIPRKILEALCKEKLESSLVHKIENISFRAYPDHKIGITVGAALANDKAHHDRYWEKFKDVDPDTELCPGFGEGLLKQSVDYVSKLSPKSSKSHVDEEVDSKWLEVSKAIASWGVSGRGLLS